MYILKHNKCRHEERASLMRSEPWLWNYMINQNEEANRWADGDESEMTNTLCDACCAFLNDPKCVFECTVDPGCCCFRKVFINFSLHCLPTKCTQWIPARDANDHLVAAKERTSGMVGVATVATCVCLCVWLMVIHRGFVTTTKSGHLIHLSLFERARKLYVRTVFYSIWTIIWRFSLCCTVVCRATLMVRKLHLLIKCAYIVSRRVRWA